MRRLVTIDLTGADLALFESFEAKVLQLVPKYGGRLEMRVRALDNSSETHLLYFPDAQNYDSYRSDPARAFTRSTLKKAARVSRTARLPLIIWRHHG